MKRHDPSRRAFLRASAALSTVGAAGSGIALNLATIGAAAAATTVSDYKAIVCLFMFGGNDTHNMVLSYDEPSWSGYTAARNIAPDPVNLDKPGTGNMRSTLAIAHSNANGLNGGRQFALHPGLPKMKALFEGTAAGVPSGSKPAAIVANIGPLLQPTTRADMNVRGFPLPPKLFSHNDQQSTWMAYGPEGTVSNGWGGRLGDLLMSNNGAPIFTCVSLAGNNPFLSGQQAVQYQMSSNGAAGIAAVGATSVYGVSATPAVLQAIVTDPRQNLFEREQVRVTGRSIDARQMASDAFGKPITFTTPFPAGGIGAQLQAVARMINGRDITGAKRQVFFVSMGGFDNHDFLLNAYGTTNGQPGLMAALDNAVDAFYKALVQMGVADSVTLFTGSDFGRTLTSNGDGSDHGWGAHHFVVGGAVRGGDVYGAFPVVGVGGPAQPYEVGQGRLLPGLAVDQLGGALGRWFGVSDADLLTIMPNLSKFGTGGTPTAIVNSALTRISVMG